MTADHIEIDSLQWSCFRMVGMASYSKTCGQDGVAWIAQDFSNIGGGGLLAT